MLQILSIEFDFDRNGQIIATIDLCPTGQPGRELVDAKFGSSRNQVILVKQSGPWPHKAHVTINNAP